MDEFALIETYFAGDDGARIGIGDDAAVVDVPQGEQLVVAVDTIVAGRHFPDRTPPRAIGHRALAVNLSDLAAMGARPRWYTLALTLPEAHTDWLDAFSAGLRDLGRRHGCALIGGDTTRGPLTVSVQAMGLVEPPALTRAGARPGDRIYVGGSLGDAAAGLGPAGAGRDTALARRFLYPQPQLELGRALRGVASACIDVSDGLVADLGHVLAASEVGAEVDVNALPLSDALRAALDLDAARALALTGGDDYVLCFTVPVGTHAACLERCHEIGVVTEAPGLRVIGADGNTLEFERDGYRHF